MNKKDIAQMIVDQLVDNDCINLTGYDVDMQVRSAVDVVYSVLRDLTIVTGRILPD